MRSPLTSGTVIVIQIPRNSRPKHDRQSVRQGRLVTHEVSGPPTLTYTRAHLVFVSGMRAGTRERVPVSETQSGDKPPRPGTR